MGRNLHHAVRRETGVPQRAWLLHLGGGCRLGSLWRSAPSGKSEPASRPALSFRVCAWIGACAIVTAIATGSRAADSPGSELASPIESAEEGCHTIRRALNHLAEAERAQALALDLGATPGSSTAVIEARLATLIERTNHLRDVLRQVRKNAPARDPRVEQCSRMGFHALEEAQKLTSSVEELLRNRESAEASPPAGFRSDAVRGGSVAQP